MPSTYTLAGFVFDNAGKAVSSAEISIFKANTTTAALSTTVTDASGFWQAASSSFSAVDGGFDADVQVTNAATGSVGRIKHKDRIMTEAVIVREIFLSPDSNDSVDASRGFFTTLLATADQGEAHTVTFPKLTGAPLITATAQDSNGAITLSSAETITTAGDITMSSGTLTVGGNFTVSSLGVVTSSGQITAASSLHVSSGSLNVGGGNFTVSSAGVMNALNVSGNASVDGTFTVGGLTTINDTLTVGQGFNLTSGTLNVGGGNFTVDSAGAVVVGSSLLVTGNASFSGTLTTVGDITVSAPDSVSINLVSGSSAQLGDIIFGDNDSAVEGRIRYDHNVDKFSMIIGGGTVLTMSSANSTFAQPMTLTQTLTVNGKTTINDTLAVTDEFTTAAGSSVGFFGVATVSQPARSTTNTGIAVILTNLGLMAAP